jgi:hypothetical protein
MSTQFGGRGALSFLEEKRRRNQSRRGRLDVALPEGHRCTNEEACKNKLFEVLSIALSYLCFDGAVATAGFLAVLSEPGMVRQRDLPSK